MADLVKFLAAPEGAPAFEIDVETHQEAEDYIKKNFRGSGEVKLLVKHYTHTTTTPHIIKTCIEN